MDQDTQTSDVAVDLTGVLEGALGQVATVYWEGRSQTGILCQKPENGGWHLKRPHDSWVLKFMVSELASARQEAGILHLYCHGAVVPPIEGPSHRSPAKIKRWLARRAARDDSQVCVAYQGKGLSGFNLSGQLCPEDGGCWLVQLDGEPEGRLLFTSDQVDRIEAGDWFTIILRDL